MFCSRFQQALYGVLLLLSIGACSSHPEGLRSGYQFDFAARPVDASSSALAPGAVVAVKFLRTPELDEEQVVRADGAISLPMLGDVMVVGQTPQQLREALIEAYQGKLVDPDVRVLIRKAASQRIFVGGQVQRSGMLPLDGNLTALQAVMQAGGPDMSAACLENVVVIRHDNETRQGYVVNLSESLFGSESSKPFHLRNNDIVYVPRTSIAKVDQWIDQHINRIVPDIGFFFTRSVGSKLQYGFQTAR